MSVFATEMPALYDIGVALYHTGIRIAALFNPKARAWVQGRRGTWHRLEEKSEALRGCLWMHCASVGEFEQGRPVLEAMKREQPGLPVLITFYSPSGYEARKDFQPATHVEYLPADGAANAKRFLELVQPKAVLWVKYEFWYHYLNELSARAIPVFLISAIFRREQPFFKWYGGTHRRMLTCFTRLFVQDDASRAMLATVGVANVDVSGDTRFDRVAEIAASNDEWPVVPDFKGGQPLLIAGSTWPADEALLLLALGATGSPPKTVIVPHELNEDHLLAIEHAFPKPLVRWSELEGIDAANIASTLGRSASGTLLCDRMGLLARLYRYADVVHVGGGFGEGIHSLLEAAAWGKPVIFGPNHRKFAEAKGLIDAGGGFEVNDAQQLRTVLERLLNDAEAGRTASAAALRYVRDRVGATDRIVHAISALLR